MRILITGGAGFIGSNLARLAVREGTDVTVLDDLSTGHRDNLDELSLKFIRASVLDSDAVTRAMQGVDAIVHLAALGSVPRSVKDPLGSHAANATGTLTVLEGARAMGIRHVVVSSSSSVYGLNKAVPNTERDWVRPMSPYAVSKLATEQYVLAYQQSYGMQTTAFRLFNVYGPGQRPGHPYAAVIPVFMDAVLKNQPMRINGDGCTSRDFTFVDPVCEVLLEAALRGVGHPEPVNLAFGTSTTLNELVIAIGKVANSQPTVKYDPPRAGDVQHSRGDGDVLQSLFPNVRPVDLLDGLATTFSWLGAR